MERGTSPPAGDRQRGADPNDAQRGRRLLSRIAGRDAIIFMVLNKPEAHS